MTYARAIVVETLGIDARSIQRYRGEIIIEVSSNDIESIAFRFKTHGHETKGRFLAQHSDGTWVACKYGGRAVRDFSLQQQALDFLCDAPTNLEGYP